MIRTDSTSINTKPVERIIQFGEGNFLRAFVEWMVQEMNEKTDFNTSVVVLSGTSRTATLELLKNQGYKYNINLQGIDNSETLDSLIENNVISRAVSPYIEFDSFLNLAHQPNIRFIISNTTEAGIVYEDTCKFTDRPASSYPAKLTQWLYERFKTFKGDSSKGVIILPCELIFDNGKKLKECVDKYLDLWKEDIGKDYISFREWINNHCFFCTTLVDRIVPGFPKHDSEEIIKRIGWNDRLLVQAEPFHLWVIEVPDNLSITQLKKEFPAEKSGLNVVITENEAPYHKRKLTLLNAPHTLLSPVSFLAGVDYVRDACQHPVIGSYIRKVLFSELVPTLDIPEDESMDYASSVLERFLNPFIDHNVSSIMLNAVPKFHARVVPALKKIYQKNKKLPVGIVFGLAALITYYKGGKRGDGAPIIPEDDHEIKSFFKELWKNEDKICIAEKLLSSDYLNRGDGERLNEIPGLSILLAEFLESIEKRGILNALSQVI